MSTNRYQVIVNNVIQTIIQTDNSTNRWPLLAKLVKTSTYDVVRWGARRPPSPGCGSCRAVL